MPTIVSHGVSALLIGKSLHPQKAYWRLWFWSAVCAMLPDADVIGFAFGIRYEDFWGHRGFSHSLLFAVLVGAAISVIFKKPLHKTKSSTLFWIFYFSLIIASHGIYDAITNGGLGIAFFAPFDNTRYFFPWQPVNVSPIGIKGIFTERGVRVFTSEFIYIIVPLLPLFLIRWWSYRKFKS